MKNVTALQTHIWAEGTTPRQILQDGRTIVHHRCPRCGRDFAFELDGSGWHAAYVGLLRIEVLSESVSARWLAEECPGRPLWIEDQKARETRLIAAGADLISVATSSPR
jgi:hypothetical protein